MRTTHMGCSYCGCEHWRQESGGKVCDACNHVWKPVECCDDCMRPVERCYCNEVSDLLSKAQSILSSVKVYMDWPERQRDLMAIAVNLIDRADAVVAGDNETKIRDACHFCDGIGAVEERDGWDLCPVCKGRGHLKAVQTA